MRLKANSTVFLLHTSMELEFTHERLDRSSLFAQHKVFMHEKVTSFY